MGTIATVLTMITFVVQSGCELGANIWLSEWSKDSSRNTSDPNLASVRVGVYGGIGLGQSRYIRINVSLIYWCNPKFIVCRHFVASSSLCEPGDGLGPLYISHTVVLGNFKGFPNPVFHNWITKGRGCIVSCLFHSLRILIFTASI